MPPLEVPLVQSDDDDAEVEDAANESLAYCGTTRRGIVSYLAAVLLLAVCGNLYGMSAYAGAIKAQKQLDDGQITM